MLYNGKYELMRLDTPNEAGICSYETGDTYTFLAGDYVNGWHITDTLGYTYIGDTYCMIYQIEFPK